jgi:hypothetical protein
VSLEYSIGCFNGDERDTKQTKSGKKRKKPEIPTFLALFVLLSFLHPSCLFCIHLSFIDEA